MKINPKTFISYSHDSEELKEIILAFANQLRRQGINCNLDQYEESPENGWISWMETEICSSDYVLVVCTEGYAAKLGLGSQGPHGKGVKWEGAMFTQELYESEGKNRKFIPVLLRDEDKAYIPRPLRSYTYYNILTGIGYEKLYRRITKQIAIEKPPVGEIIKLPRSRKNTLKQSSTSNLQATSLSQHIIGNNNVQIGELNMRAGSTARVTILPAHGTIGADHLLKQAIMDRFNKLGEEREKRFGKRAYPVMYKLFKRSFGVKKGPWTIIWNWPDAAADEIIKYLDEKYANTIAGRIEGSAQEESRIPSKGHLFKREKELLAQLDLKISSPEVTGALERYFGVNSHTMLDSLKHWHWLMYLEKLVRQQIGEQPAPF